MPLRETRAGGNSIIILNFGCHFHTKLKLLLLLSLMNFQKYTTICSESNRLPEKGQDTQERQSI